MGGGREQDAEDSRVSATNGRPFRNMLVRTACSTYNNAQS